MILPIAGLILSIILILCFIDIRIGAAAYLAYFILVPINDITIGPLHVGENLVRTLLIIALLYDFKIKHHYKLCWKLLNPFIVYFAIELVLIPFQSETPTSWMTEQWRLTIMHTLIGPFVFYNVLSVYPSSISYFRKSLITSILIAGVYGLYLTSIPGFNPYINLIVLSTGTSIDAEKLMNYFAATDRLFGRVSSVFMHPMTFGLFIGLAFIYIFSIRNNIKKKLYIPILIILGLDALFCGVRSCIGGLVIAIAFYLIFCRKIKIGIAALILGLIIYNIILKMPELSDYLGSMVDINNSKSDVSGSSLEMRLDQLNGCLVEIRNHPFIGKGYDWTGYYQDKFGDHPVILAFESLIFVILCDNGFLGLGIWSLLVIMIMKYNHKININDTVIANSLLVFYIAYSCITGEYGYMKYFLPFYICLVFENKNVTNKNNNQNMVQNKVLIREE